MAAFSQTPAEISITCVQGDELAIAIDTHQSLVGYTLSAIVYSQALASSSGSIGNGATYTVGDTAATFTIADISRSAGTVKLSLTETQTAALSPSGRYRWFFRWQDTAGYTQAILAGAFNVVIP
jgi:hypothetical protein